MGFKAKKIYGNYKILHCPFCSKNATTRNEQGLDVCYQHKKELFPEIKCTCGSWLEIRSGKFGPYFNCINCGNLNMAKAQEIKSITMKNQSIVNIPQKSEKLENPKISQGLKHTQSYFSNRFKEVKKGYIKKPKEITIDTNDVEYFS